MVEYIEVIYESLRVFYTNIKAMTATEVWALLGTIGFVGLAAASFTSTVAVVRRRTLLNEQRRDIAYGGISGVFALLPAAAALIAAPFEFYSVETLTIINGIIIWAVFIGVLAGVWRWNR